MADRKPTVLNPAGYQENLQDTDNLIVEAAPTADNHAVNKGYADTEIADAGKWEESSGNLYPKNLSNNVGIGTDTPQGELVVRASTPQIYLEPTSDVQNTRLNFCLTDGSISSAIQAGGKEDGIKFITDGSEKVRINSNGNVGIGDDDPSQKLSVRYDGSQIRISKTGANTEQYLDLYAAGDYSFLTAKDNNDSGGFVFRGRNSSDYIEYLRILNDGRVGIGTSSPGYKLTAFNSDLTQVASFESGQPESLLRFSTTGTTKGPQVGGRDDDLLFRTNFERRMTIKADGKVGIGTDSPGTKLNIADTSCIVTQTATGDNSAARYGITRYSFSDGGGAEVVAYRSTGKTASDVALTFRCGGIDSANNKMVISSNGNVGIGTDAPESLFHLKSADAEVLQIMENSVGTVKLYSNNKSFIVDADQHRFRSESGDEYARILANGNVGIGTDDPSANLEIANTPLPGVPTLYLSQAPSISSTSDIALTGNAAIRSEGSIRNVVNTGGFFNWLIGGDDNKAGTAGASEVMRITPAGLVGIGTDSPEARLTINPGNSANTSIGGRGIAYGVNAITTSGRTGFLVRNSNNYLQNNDNSAFQFLYPFNDGITSDYKVFRTAKGSTLSDVFWTSINGNGYFAGNVTAASFTGPVTGDITGDITGNINGNVVGDVTGDLTGNVTGNADTATKLKTARNINGTPFDGTSAITTAKWGTARSLNGVSVDGSANKTLEPYVERDDSSNTARYLTFVDNSTAGYKRLNMDTNLNYNPSLNKLYTNVSGDAGSIDGLDSTQFLRSDANDTATGKITFDAGIRLNDNDVAEFGSSADYKVAYDGSNAIHNVTSGDFYFQNNGTSRIFFDMSAGNILPTSDNTGYVGTSANTWNNGRFTNFTVDSVLTVRGAIDLADNDKIRLGSGDDTEMYYNGSHTYIDLKTTGNFYIRDGTTSRFYVTKSGNANLTGKLTVGNFDLESLPALP